MFLVINDAITLRNMIFNELHGKLQSPYNCVQLFGSHQLLLRYVL